MRRSADRAPTSVTNEAVCDHHRMYIVLAMLLAAAPCTNPVGDATSPDGHVKVFISRDESRQDDTSLGAVAHEDLCVSRDGGAATILLAGRALSDAVGPERSLASFASLLFSPDGATLFFTTTGWVTSPAAHSVGLATGKEAFLFDGAVVAAVGENFLASHYRLDAQYPVDSPKYRGRMESWSLVTRAGRLLRKVTEAEATRLRK